MATEQDDEVLAEVRRVRDEYAKSHGYDLERIFADIKRREKESDRPTVRRPPKRLEKPEDEAA